ncbi:MAG: hypothetical protein LBN98_04255 [Prevotellaceae bacterium]|jgi:hypothetical protein|nr:hypothetical protein [Prevotellaceae bacterium]
MEIIRKIMQAEQLSPVMYIPPQMQDKRVEVIVLPVVEAATSSPATDNMKGYLKQYANPALMEQEKNAWAMNLKEKYGNL